jgi:hypothetical protein
MMTVTFHDWEEDENPLNGTVVRDSDELRKMLLGLQGREPFACELEGESGACLVLGVGEVGTAQYSREEGGPYFLAVTNSMVIADTEVEFLAGGTPTPFDARFCLPFDDVIRIAVHFMDTGEACPSFSWEMI